MFKLISFCIILTVSFFSKPLIAQESFGFSAIKTANSSGTLEAMVVDGGRFFEVRKLAHVAVLIKHPDGDFLWDTGLGREVEQQMEVFNFLDKQLFKVENHAPARDQLAQNNYDLSRLKMVIPSHMHWDHVSGLEDFTGVPVWVQRQSYDEALAGNPPGFVASQFDSEEIVWNFLSLNDREYEGFSKSLDIYGDGKAVLVDISGHSHGHLGLFVNLSAEQRYFFIGDATWVYEGVESNSSRPSIIKWLVGVDADFEQNAAVVDKIYALHQRLPKLRIVPAHDERVLLELPRYPEFQSAAN
jgi:glyoxylase-like metal-dependent hydrolase (beta-lactamase superfamily II)